MQNLSDTWLSHDTKKAEAVVGTAAALHKLNSIKARLRNARSEVYCTLQVCLIMPIIPTMQNDSGTTAIRLFYHTMCTTPSPEGWRINIWHVKCKCHVQVKPAMHSIHEQCHNVALHVAVVVLTESLCALCSVRTR